MKINIKERKNICVREVRTINFKEVRTIDCRKVLTFNFVDVNYSNRMGDTINIRRV